jgi:hypothetical protein
MRTIVVPQPLVLCFIAWSRPALPDTARARILALRPPVSLSDILGVTFDYAAEFGQMESLCQKLEASVIGFETLLHVRPKILFYSILSVLFYSVLFCSILFFLSFILIIRK